MLMYSNRSSVSVNTQNGMESSTVILTAVAFAKVKNALNYCHWIQERSLNSEDIYWVCDIIFMNSFFRLELQFRKKITSTVSIVKLLLNPSLAVWFGLVPCSMTLVNSFFIPKLQENYLVFCMRFCNVCVSGSLTFKDTCTSPSAPAADVKWKHCRLWKSNWEFT